MRNEIIFVVINIEYFFYIYYLQILTLFKYSVILIFNFLTQKINNFQFLVELLYVCRQNQMEKKIPKNNQTSTKTKILL